MAETLDEIRRQLDKLSPKDRARLAEFLLESLQEPPLSDVSAAWQHEIAERVAAYDRGEVKLISAEDVFAEALGLLHN